MIRTALLALAILLLLPLSAPAAGEVPIRLEDVVRALESPFRADAPKGEIVGFQGGFVQQSRIASLDRVQNARGTVAVRFDRSGENSAARTLFRWEYEAPEKQLIVSDGRTMWVYLPENLQVIRSEVAPSSGTRPDDPMVFLTGLGNLSRDFLIDWASPDRDAEGNYALMLRPRKESAMLKGLRVVVRKEAVSSFNAGERGAAFPIRSTSVHDSSENSTTIEFTDVRINPDLPRDRFRFDIPEGVQVLSPSDFVQ